ncbi:MAG: hypothetical protein U9Q83_01575, partial [Bacteroidota bacterium]|nr:hypothetical protein [Bacteroidota bacterium]
MRHSKTRTFLTRIVFIFSLQLIIKAFDTSFGKFSDFTVRGLFFTVFLMILWTGGWYFAEYVNKKITDFKRIYKL